MTTGQTVLMRTASRVAVQLPTMAGDRSLYLLRPLHATTTITANITIISGKRHPWWFLTSPSLLYTTSSVRSTCSARGESSEQEQVACAADWHLS